MGCTLLYFTLLPLLAGSYAQPSCTLILPSVLHVENEETIVLDAQGHSSPFDAFIEIQDFPHRKNVLTQAKVSVNSANNYLGVAKLSVPSKDLPQDPKKKQFVYVTVKSSCPLEKVVLLSFRSGYIFIETDKTIYTPGSRVLYHIFKMNNMLQPDNRPIIMEFRTPDGTIIWRDIAHRSSNLGIISQTYMLSDLASVGVWTIAAKYEDSPQHIYTANFEVKEYVLPRFEVSLLPRRFFFYVRENSFELKIKAQFLYGKPVEGKAFVLFGVKKDGVKRGIPDTLREVPVEKGEGECSMDAADLFRFFRNDDDMSQFTLYVSVTVITKSGSELVEAELENIQIVTSPYKILFTNTAKYFKPGMLFDVTAFVTDPDGSPANGIPVVAEPGGVEGTTQEDGTARLKLSTTADVNFLEITVKTAVPALPLNHQVSVTMTAIAYKTLGGHENFLHIGVTSSEVKLGETVAVNFNVRSGDLGTQNQIQYFTYLIINKGRIMTVARQPRQAGQTVVTMSLAVTENHIPSFHIVAYYIVQTAAGREIMSDSIWVDVKDTCMGTLELTGEKDKDNGVQRPFSLMRLKLRTTHKAYVAFVAVDKGVYALNRNFKISQSKVWDLVEKSTIDCSLEDGANSQGAFTDAGLTLQTNFTISSVKRSGSPCQASLVQKQRTSVVTGDFKSTKPLNYHSHKRTCCEKGMKERPVGQSCEQSSLLILDGKECADTFLTCCKHFEKEKGDEELLKEEDMNGGYSEDDEYMADEDILLRSDCQESWFWRVQNMGNKPDNNGISSEMLRVFVKDSITTWEVLAVSLSENKGICVSEPFEIRAMQDFFIDLRLPYSAVRNEEVEIRTVLYNYGRNKLKVRVELTHNPEFCSLSTSKKKFRQEVSVNGLSSAVVSFVVVPLNLGSHDIEVKAAVSGAFLSDGVRKKLKVVPEGMRVFQTIKSVILDPEVKGVGGVQTENILPLDVKNKVPNTDVTTIITIKGSPVNPTLEDATDGQYIIHMITAPSGNGEQNIIAMTHSVIATVYLDATNQWEKMGFERRAEAIENIRQGYIQQLGYWKADGSFSAIMSRGSSTWLTAYVAKVFALAQPLVYISHKELCGAFKWLILERQRPDGLFQETTLVIQQEMMGRIKGSSEPDAALTAFVLIAMLESRIMCEDAISILKVCTDRAASFLTGQYPTLREPYTVAITSYALAKAGFLDDTKTLMAASTDNSHWLDRGSIVISLEATAYALLALLEMKQYELTGPIVRWLTEQRYYGEGSASTQATVISFQAQAQYHQVFPIHSDLELDVYLHVPHRTLPIRYRIDPRNAMLARSFETQETKEIMVKAQGRGQVTLTVSAVYHTLATEEERKCSNFDLSVNVTEVNNVKANSHDSDYSTLSLGICFRHLKGLDASMSVVEVSMLTGFIPDVEELKKLFHGAGNHISRYEIKKDTTGIGSLVIYLDKVSHKKEECLKVVAHQIFKVGLIQPASVTVYDYYNPESRCNTFYKWKKGNGRLGRICQGNVSL